MPADEAEDLISTKLVAVRKAAQEEGTNLEIDPSVIDRVVKLSGGHPHLLQLLGSHLIEHENQDPDGILDARDLVNSLRTICYEDRARVYDAIVHLLELEGMLEPLRSILGISSSKCPTRIDRKLAQDMVSIDALDWLVSQNILMPSSSDEYALVDEFLRVRMFFDEVREEEETAAREQLLIGDMRFYSEREDFRDRWNDEIDEL